MRIGGPNSGWLPAARPAPRGRWPRPLVAAISLLLSLVYVSLPLVHALHVAAEEACAVDDSACLPGEAAGGGREDLCDCGAAACEPGHAGHHHHHHDESHCALCQLLAAIRSHAVAPPAVEISPHNVVVRVVPIRSASLVVIRPDLPITARAPPACA